MIRRKSIMKFRRHFCSALAAALVIYVLHNGAENNLRTTMQCAAIALCAYGICWAVDRLAGCLSPIIIDLRKVPTLDRSDPNQIIIGKGDDKITIEVDSDDEVWRIAVGPSVRKREITKEFCYLQVGDNRFVRIDAEYAFMLYRILKDRDLTPEVSGVSYQTASSSA